jgi:hypothetical protein
MSASYEIMMDLRWLKRQKVHSTLQNEVILSSQQETLKA